MDAKQIMDMALHVRRLTQGHRDAGGDGHVEVHVRPFGTNDDGLVDYELMILTGDGNGVVGHERLTPEPIDINAAWSRLNGGRRN